MNAILRSEDLARNLLFERIALAEIDVDFASAADVVDDGQIIVESVTWLVDFTAFKVQMFVHADIMDDLFFGVC